MWRAAGSRQKGLEPDPTSAFRLFAAIDHQRIGDDRTGWVALVLGVHTSGAESWVQVAAHYDPSRSVLLHIPQSATAQQALAALQAYANGRDLCQQVIEVRPDGLNRYISASEWRHHSGRG